MLQNGFDLIEVSSNKDPLFAPGPGPKGTPSGSSHSARGTAEGLLQPVGFQHHVIGVSSYIDL